MRALSILAVFPGVDFWVLGNTIYHDGPAVFIFGELYGRMSMPFMLITVK
jgi:hypothetical protein